MGFYKEPNHLAGCLIVAALAGVLLLAVGWGNDSRSPKVFHNETDLEPNTILECISTTEGERLFGKLSNIPVANRFVLHRAHTRAYLHLTGERHHLVVYKRKGATKFLVRADRPLSRQQTEFVQMCSRSSSHW